MPDRLVLDSSVIAAIFFREEGVSEEAEKVVEKFSKFYTLDLAVAEVTNVAWKKVAFEGERAEVVERALTNCIEFITSVCEVVSSAELCGTAFKIAVERGISAYDSLFIALSEKYDAPIVTADRRLYEKAGRGILIGRRV